MHIFDKVTQTYLVLHFEMLDLKIKIIIISKPKLFVNFCGFYELCQYSNTHSHKKLLWICVSLLF